MGIETAMIGVQNVAQAMGRNPVVLSKFPAPGPVISNVVETTGSIGPTLKPRVGPVGGAFSTFG